MQIVTTHNNADFDALAAMIAATLLYPGAVPVVPGNVNPNVRAFLSIHKDLFHMVRANEIQLDRVDHLVVVDTNSWERLDRMDSLRERHGLEIHVWDHHTDGATIVPTWACIEKAGATVTLLVRELKARRLPLTPIQATLLLAGVYEDTGNLTFPSTTAEDAHAAGFLLEHKADLAMLNTFLRPAYGEKQKELLFNMLASARRVDANGRKISITCQRIDGHVSGLALVVGMFREIMNVDAAFGLFSESGRDDCIVIGRSRGRDLDVGDIMRKLGGGGHPGAGSAMVRAVDPGTVSQAILALITGEPSGSVRVADLMSYPVVSVTPETTMQEAAMILRDKGCSGMPVMAGGRLVGMISRRDFRKLRNEGQTRRPVKAFMSRQVVTIGPEKSPSDAGRLMVKHDIGRLPVMADGELIGIITRSDAMRYFYDLLPD